MKITKKHLLLLGVFLLFAVCYSSITMLMSIPSEKVHVYYSENCTHAKAWAAHMDQNGFKTELHLTEDMKAIKDKYEIPEDLRGCHTATYDGYVIEGHVPAQSLTHLYAAKSPVIGLAVKGYPIGAPGLEGGYPEMYQVITFDKDKNEKVFEVFNENIQ